MVYQPKFYPRKAPANLDMVWMPSHDAWFCNKCCEIIIEGDKMFRKERHPRSHAPFKGSQFAMKEYWFNRV